MQEANH